MKRVKKTLFLLTAALFVSLLAMEKKEDKLAIPEDEVLKFMKKLDNVRKDNDLYLFAYKNLKHMQNIKNCSEEEFWKRLKNKAPLKVDLHTGEFWFGEKKNEAKGIGIYFPTLQIHTKIVDSTLPIGFLSPDQGITKGIPMMDKKTNHKEKK